jgi:hypothetical protein
MVIKKTKKKNKKSKENNEGCATFIIHFPLQVALINMPWMVSISCHHPRPSSFWPPHAALH